MASIDSRLKLQECQLMMAETKAHEIFNHLFVKIRVIRGQKNRVL